MGELRITPETRDEIYSLYEKVKEVFDKISYAVDLAVKIKLAYVKASIHHPEWVRQAKHNKRWRIRKKYHVRIMRKYGVAR